MTAGLILFVFALTRAPTEGWTSPEVILSFVGWAVLSTAFILIELRSRSPLVPLSIFRRRTLSAANGIGLILGTAVFGMFYLLSLYMQIVLGFSALETGLGYLAVALTAVVASGVAQALTTRAGVKPVLAAGMGLLAAGLIFFTQISADGSYVADLLPGFFLIGVGLGFAFVPVSIAALSGASDKEAGLASGLINTNQQIGGAIGLAILISISTTRSDNLIEDGVADAVALTDGYSLAFWVAAGFAILGVIVTLFALKREDLVMEPAEEGSQLARLGSRSWLSRRERRRSRGATSVVRSTRSRLRASPSALSAASPRSLTACARRARRTAGARSSLCELRPPSAHASHPRGRRRARRRPCSGRDRGGRARRAFRRCSAGALRAVVDRPGGARARRDDRVHRDAREAGGGRSRQARQLARGFVPVGGPR